MAKSKAKPKPRKKARAAKKVAKPKPKKVQSVPAGCHTVTPHLVVQGGTRAIEFYKRAFGAKEMSRMPGPDGQSIMHAELKIGDSVIFLCDEFPGSGSRAPHSLGGTSTTIHLYVPNADSVFQQALNAGASVAMPLADMFWGDRYGKVTDPFGHEWSIATHKEDVPPREMGKRAEAAFASMGPG